VSNLQHLVTTKIQEIEEMAIQLTEEQSDMAKATDTLVKETEGKKKSEIALHEAQQTVKNLRDESTDLRETIQTLHKSLIKSAMETEIQREEMNKCKLALTDSKGSHEVEKKSSQEALDTKEQELQRLFKLVQKMEKSAESKGGFIADLENTVDELKVLLESEITKVYTLSATKASNDDERKRLAQDIKTLTDQISKERSLKSTEITKLHTSLDSKALKNKKLKDMLDNTYQDNEDRRKAMEEALEESNTIRKEVSEMLQRTKEDLTTRINELEEDKRCGETTTQKRLEELSTRISDLSTMKESLQSENMALMVKIQEDKQSTEQLFKKNKQLKMALSGNEKKIREEMKELEFVMNTTITKIESKQKQSIEEERVKISLSIDKLEDENDTYKIKITQLESIIRRLERQSSMGIRGHSEGGASREEADALRNENDRLQKRISNLEKQNSSFSSTTEEYHHHHGGSPGRGDRSPRTGGSGSDYYIIEYRLEKERRIKAEEFAAAMAARAKAGFEERNEDIVGLRMKVSSLEADKENFDHQQQLMLPGSATLQNPTELVLAMQERDEAVDEANRYKSIANKLNEQVITMNQMIEDGETEAVRLETTSTG
jgi:predicted  nucleic acid-binding Zn-ribbon protein